MLKLQAQQWKLTLWLTANPSPQLFKSQFECFATGESYICHRGTAKRHERSVSYFRWSAAVRALTALLVRHYGAQLSRTSDVVCLQGEKGSLAASLDYALSKQPSWLLDVFGVSFEGEPNARKLLLRINAERKRPGPVLIRFSDWACSNVSLRIYLDGVLLRCTKAVEALSFTLECDAGPLALKFQDSDALVINYPLHGQRTLECLVGPL